MQPRGLTIAEPGALALDLFGADSIFGGRSQPGHGFEPLVWHGSD